MKSVSKDSNPYPQMPFLFDEKLHGTALKLEASPVLPYIAGNMKGFIKIKL